MAIRIITITTAAMIPILPNFDAQRLVIKSIGPPSIMYIVASDLVCVNRESSQKKPPGKSRGHNSTRRAAPTHRGLSVLTELLLRALAST